MIGLLFIKLAIRGDTISQAILIFWAYSIVAYSFLWVTFLDRLRNLSLSSFLPCDDVIYGNLKNVSFGILLLIKSNEFSMLNRITNQIMVYSYCFLFIA